MTKYQEFLEKINVISESEFDSIIQEFSDVDINSLEFYEGEYSVEDIIKVFIEAILDNYSYVYIDDIDFNERTISLEDVASLEDLESIKQKLSGWNITNYGEIKEYLLEEEKEGKRNVEHLKKMNIISDHIDNIPVEDLKEFVKKYGNKR